MSSQSPSSNPFASPAEVPPVSATALAFKPISKIEYFRMYQYVFENPNWLKNILLGALCSLIPIVGPLVMIGYQFEAIEALLASQGGRYPDFIFDRFADYLVRGLWPFLVQLVASLVIAPLMLIVILVPMLIVFAIAGAAGDESGPVVIAVGMPLLALVVFPLSIAISVVLVPPLLRAGLAQDFAEGFNFGWIMDFLKRTWMETFLALLFIAVSAGLLGILGMLACYVGIFFVMPLVFLAQANMYYQLYLLYLSRDGMPVQRKIAPYAPPR
jgi:hypothetical protein